MAALRYMSGRELVTRRCEREAKLAWIAEQVAHGALVIRQATVEERKRYGIAADAGRATVAPALPARARRRPRRPAPGEC
jgi:hypothetical protein